MDIELAATADAVRRDSVHARVAGHLLVLGYFIALPPLMAVTVFRGFYQRMGFIRLHGAGELAAVHGLAADQDGFALDV